MFARCRAYLTAPLCRAVEPAVRAAHFWHCRRVWRYAVNAVLHELRGERQGVVAWTSGQERAALRKQYVQLYRRFLERQHLEGGSAAAAAVSLPAMPSNASCSCIVLLAACMLVGWCMIDWLLCFEWAQARHHAAAATKADHRRPALERQLSVDDILSCRQVAQRVLEASLAAAAGMGRPPQPSAASASSSRSRRRPHALPASVAGTGSASGSLGGTSASAAAAAAAGRPAVSLGSSSSAGSAAAGSGDGRRTGYLAWGLSKAAGFLRYMPYSASEEV